MGNRGFDETDPEQRNTPKKQTGADYRCSAEGCPLRATIFDNVVGPPNNGRCRYHDAAERKDWPQLTNWFTTLEFTEEVMSPRLRGVGLRWLEPPLPSIPKITGERPEAILARLQALLSRPAPPSDSWWHALITRWRNGEELLEIQRTNAVRAWKAAGKPADWAPPKIPKGL